MIDIINPLNVFVVWHPFFTEGEIYANSFFSYYNHDINDPLSRGIGIPVYYRTGENPHEIDLGDAEYNAIILLINDEMVISDHWVKYLNEIIENASQTNDKSIIFPVAISNNAFKLPSKLPDKNFIRLYDIEINKIDYLISSTTHELCRLLYNIDRIADVVALKQSPPPLKLFISHAKEDGVDVAKKLSDHIQSQTALKTFFDANDIAIGYDFTQEIEENIRDSVLLVVHSDKYSSREWCRREVLIAKRNNRPIIVVNLFDEGEDRSFPYMANLRTIRFNRSITESVMFEKIILLTLKETLRFKYHYMFVLYLTKKFTIEVEKDAILSHPPELLSLLQITEKGNKLAIYPDPPLSEEELEIIIRAKGDVQFITPTFIPILKKIDEYKIHEFTFLDGLNVGLSISESQNIKDLGFEHIHLQDTLVEFTRYLLVSGASLSYGGGITYDPKFNFAQILFDLARGYQKEKIRPSDKITNFVAYPIYTQISSGLRAQLNDIARFVEVPPPNNLGGDHNKIFRAETVEDLFVWAKSLSEMRRIMDHHIDARIILGGKITGFKGSYPGIVEEAYLALKSKRPVYLIGSMGGASKVIIDCILGSHPEELSEKYQFMNPQYKEFYSKYNELAELNGTETLSYKRVVDFFNQQGIAGLNNGLNEDENRRLFYTKNSIEMISLVLKGLMSIQNINK
ncbi:TIR domain-containing protein [Paenibacillus sediminis]|uniref:TIR domain-containing protein n=1 Tax=Paenibacillus sediminis TaxID=664909 RepID=A0ABS4H7H0_9BACL|nr:TIR domain-containing protein [Paenibacillus sediminis]MBP1938493.1 hypothetical protein [Paenibacillus sediminis]